MAAKRPPRRGEALPPTKGRSPPFQPRILQGARLDSPVFTRQFPSELAAKNVQKVLVMWENLASSKQTISCSQCCHMNTLQFIMSIEQYPTLISIILLESGWMGGLYVLEQYPFNQCGQQTILQQMSEQ